MGSGPSSVRLVQGEEKHFGNFELIAQLGRGGMADVFLGVRRDKPAELCVVKAILPELREDAEHLAMFADESRIMPLLSHPNIVRTVDFGEARGLAYLAMEFLEGMPLDRCRAAVTELGEDAALHVVRELLDGLHHAHELHGADGTSLEIVHRDVSPANVFVTYEGRVTLVDFGIAKSRARAQHTTTGVVRGKISYMAPEQAVCESVDRRADVFAAGVILWELLSGRRFWEGPGDARMGDVQILKAMTFGELPDLDGRAEIRADLAAVIRRAVAPKPDDRFSSARAFREALIAVGCGSTRASRPGPEGPFKRIELGRAVAALAGEQRTELRRVIDQHLAEARGTSGLPGIDPTFEPPEPEAARPTEPEPEPASSELDPVPSSVSVDPPGEPAVASGLVAVAGSRVEPQTGRSRKGLIVTVSLAIALVAGLALALPDATPPSVLEDGRDRAAKAPAEVAPDSPSAASAAADLILVSIDVEPRDAVVVLDGMRLSAMPFSAKFRRDGMGHELRVTAKGHVSESRIIVFDRDLELRVPLLAEPAAGPVESAPRSVRSVPTAVPPGPAAAATSAKHVADERDPWATTNAPKR